MYCFETYRAIEDPTGYPPAAGRRRLRPIGHALTLAALAALVGLAGCRTVPRNDDATEPPLASEWHWTPQSTGTTQNVAAVIAVEREWWATFHDDGLTRAVLAVIKGNYSLAEARERLAEARARRDVVRAARRPQVNLSAAYGHLETGAEAFSPLQRPGPQELDVYAVGAQARWELDLRGRIARQVAAAEAEIGAAREGRRHAAISLAAETALTYIELRALEERLALHRRAVDLLEKKLVRLDEQRAAGLTTEQVVIRARRHLSALRAQRPELEHQRAVTRNALAVLMGTPPGREVLEPGRLPRLPVLSGLGIPADLLTRRADIRAAEQRDAAARARRGAARAERIPRLRLAGAFMLSRDEADRVFDDETDVMALGAELSFPVYTGGRLGSTVEVRATQAEQSRLRLRQTILNAAREVENAAAGIVHDKARLQDLRVALEEAQAGERLARTLYDAGVEGVLRRLEAQREVVAAEEALVHARQMALAHVVQLYHALGGGWQAGSVKSFYENGM